MIEAVHARTCPGVDVAACSARGHKLKFSVTFKGITCEPCKARRAATMDSSSKMNKFRRARGVEASAADFVARYAKVT